MDSIIPLLTDAGLAALVAIVGLPAVATVFHDVGASLLSRVPKIGPALAFGWRRLSPRVVSWLRDRVAELAERAVAEAEAEHSPPADADPAKVNTPAQVAARNAAKRNTARAKLEQLAPGLEAAARDAAIEEALARVKGRGRLGVR